MNWRNVLLGLLGTFALTGCQAFNSMLCHPNCHSSARASSSLVSFLYPSGSGLPQENSIPQLSLPVRVGIAFIPETRFDGAPGLEAARRAEILERIRKHFADRKFVSQIVTIPDYYLRGRSGFDNLQGVQRLYGADVLALVSYDQVTYRDENNWSLGYLTIVGAYVLKGNQHDVVTLMDLAVVDPASRSILLRAGGTDNRRHHTTSASDARETRESQGESFSAAADDLIGHFDEALAQFESDVRAGKANVSVTRRAAGAGGAGGGGAFDVVSLVALAGVLVIMRLRFRRARSAAACSAFSSVSAARTRGRSPRQRRASGRLHARL